MTKYTEKYFKISRDLRDRMRSATQIHEFKDPRRQKVLEDLVLDLGDRLTDADITMHRIGDVLKIGDDPSQKGETIMSKIVESISETSTVVKMTSSKHRKRKLKKSRKRDIFAERDIDADNFLSTLESDLKNARKGLDEHTKNLSA